MPRTKQSEYDDLFSGAYAPFVSGEEKDELATSGRPFDILAVELRVKGGWQGKQDAWKLSIVFPDTGEARSLGLPQNEARTVQFAKWMKYLEKHDQIEGIALQQLPGKMVKNKKTGKVEEQSGAYILVRADQHVKPIGAAPIRRKARKAGKK